MKKKSIVENKLAKHFLEIFQTFGKGLRVFATNSNFLISISLQTFDMYNLLQTKVRRKALSYLISLVGVVLHLLNVLMYCYSL